MFDHAYVKAFLNLNWLRPENALCQVVDAYYVKPHLVGNRIMDLGCGNGYFTFTMMGGEFTIDYDYYVNTETRHFYQNADIYDTCKNLDISSFIQKQPERKFSLGVDYKEALLTQASQLGLYERTVLNDLNKSCDLAARDFETIYCNMIYWLDDPYKAIQGLEGLLIKRGRLILTFPDPKIFEFCFSYAWKNQKMQKLWQRLNRGRVESLKWIKSIEEFENELKAHCPGFSITYAKSYQNAITLLVWDIGLRPLSVPLIKMSEKLSVEDRREVKADFMEATLPYVNDLLENELIGKDDGGWNIVVLSKRG